MILKSENCFSLRMGYGLDFLLWHISCYYYDGIRCAKSESLIPSFLHFYSRTLQREGSCSMATMFLCFWRFFDDLT